MSTSRPRRRARPILLATISAAALAAGGLSVPAVRDVSISAGGSHLTIGAIRTDLSFIGAAFAQSADSVTLDDVTLEFGLATYRIPKIAFSGVNLSRADLAALFDAKASEPLAARLARLSAKQVTIPELTIEQSLGKERQITRYRNIAANDIVQGRIGSVASDGAGFEMTGGDKKGAVGTFGHIAASDIDLAEAARLYTETGPDTAPMKKIYGAFSIDNMSVVTDAGAEFRISRMAGKDFSARPMKTSWSEAFRIMASAPAPDDATPAEKSRMLGLVADMMGAMQIGSMEATAIDIRDPSSKEKAVGRIARIAYTGAASGQPSDARVEGFEITAADGRARIGTISFTGFSLAPTLDGLKMLSGQPLDGIDPTELRKLVPTIGTMHFSGIDFDLPNEKAKGPKPERIRFTVNDVEFTADKPLNGIPTNLRTAIDAMSFPIPAGTTEEGLQDLAAMGYKKLDSSFVAAANWNAEASELAIREVSLRAADMGSISAKATLGNVGKDVFSPDSAVAMVALVGATAKSLDITIENKGLADKLLAREAKKQKKSADDLRREYGMAAAVGIPALLGNSASAKSLGQAVARFIAKPGRLVVSAKAKDPAGLGVADLASLDDPAALLDRIAVTATAE